MSHPKAGVKKRHGTITYMIDNVPTTYTVNVYVY
jgi:hypothetical protein